MRPVVPIFLVFLLFVSACSSSNFVPTEADLAETGLLLDCIPAEPQATYQMVFTGEWSPQTHPQDFPSQGAHFTPLVGGTHNANVVFWEPGGLASQGIEDMAELGRTSPLDEIILAHQDLGNVGTLILGPRTEPSTSSTQIEFSTTNDFPLVTLVAMVAPSPDWFVGVHGLNLCENGQWLDQVAVDLFAYDSGTDHGVIYDSPDFDADPALPISRLETPPFLVNGTVPLMGTYTFTRIL